ncbi:malic enzyme-like NAD(P)-binding protein, partial [Bacillus pumilus]|uniref:malic enzyme-like NAD(P)-binding protein n=1 Tax=Bacillus pumilus TaxID=1408 RepID=UPI003703F95E
MPNPTPLPQPLPQHLFKSTHPPPLLPTPTPFENLQYNAIQHQIPQSNNPFLFPPLPLPSILTQSKIITKRIFLPSPDPIPQILDHHKPAPPLLPTIDKLQQLSIKL